VEVTCDIGGTSRGNRLRDGCDEGDNVVVRLGLYFVDALDGEICFFGELFNLFLGDLP